jgi:hypothetical protein
VSDPFKPFDTDRIAKDVFDPALAAKSIAKRKGKLRESDIEADHIIGVREQGGESYKFTSPAKRAVPDRIDLFPVPPEHREIVGRYIRFTEAKAPKEVPTPAQEREHARLRALGFTVNVVNTKRATK